MLTSEVGFFHACGDPLILLLSLLSVSAVFENIEGNNTLTLTAGAGQFAGQFKD